MPDSVRQVKITTDESDLDVLQDYMSDFHVQTDTKSQWILGRIR